MKKKKEGKEENIYNEISDENHEGTHFPNSEREKIGGKIIKRKCNQPKMPNEQSKSAFDKRGEEGGNWITFFHSPKMFESNSN